MADASLLGISLLPLLFFFLSTTLRNSEFKMFTGLAFFFGIISTYLLLMYMANEFPTYEIALVGLGYGVIAIFIISLLHTFFVMISTAFEYMGERKR